MDALGSDAAREYRMLRQIVDGTNAGVAVLDTRLRYLYVNPSMARWTGIPAEDHIGRTLAELLPHVHRSEEVLRQVLHDGHPREQILSGSTLASSAFENRSWRSTYHRWEEDGRVLGLIGVGLEISAPRHYLRTLETAHRRLTLVDAAVARIGSTLDLDTTCAELAEFMVPGLADVATVEVSAEDAPGRARPPQGVLRLRRAGMAAVPELLDAVRDFGEPGAYIDYQAGSAIPRCMETGWPISDNLASDEEFRAAAPQPERVAAYRALGIHSALVVPLLASGQAIGTVSLARAGDSPAFAPEDIKVAQALTERAALSLAKARRYTREHTMALELQRALLSEPTLPHSDLEVASRYLPSGTGALVGGDWYDTIALPGGRTLLVMGDVMGHGVEAAVAMSHYRSILRGLAGTGVDPVGILHQADHMIMTFGFDRVATCLLALVDPADGTCTYANAGHLPPALIRPTGGTLLLPVRPGPPLGTGFGGYEVLTRPLLRGSVILLYTDGLLERRDEDIDTSLRRLATLDLPTDAPLEAVLDTVLALLAPAPAEDDIAVLIARVRTT
ncbi:SpoIIE family protein phosphatase [Streptomyces sp. NPDC020858]|uniref:SpoIIE family protein phosphatase n=1 Tax=Streptomyces sp. NPDC020858 TaxID=3365097 RepID=UPI0037A44CCD